jgi:hypothetical protein
MGAASKGLAVMKWALPRRRTVLANDSFMLTIFFYTTASVGFKIEQWDEY